MPTGLLADLVLITHLGFIAFAMFGALCALRWAWAPFVHLPALGWTAYIEFVVVSFPAISSSTTN